MVRTALEDRGVKAEVEKSMKRSLKVETSRDGK